MQTKQKRKLQFGEEPVEAKARNHQEPTNVTDEAKEAIKNAWDQTLGGTGKSISEQLLGTSSLGEQQLVEGQEFVVEAKKSQEKIQVTTEHMEYFRSINNADRISETRTEQQISQAVAQIRMEIKKLMQTSKLVERTVKDATAEKAPVKPGKYHLSFFEFVLGVIRDATRKLEDTVHFGAVFTSKKQQSKYWNSYKKHGTQFGLSGERTTATQTG